VRSGRFLLVVDVGTGSGRSLIFSGAGEPIAVAQREWTHPQDPACEGALDFDCAGNWRLLCECIRRSIERAGIRADQIAAVSATSMRQGIACFDGAGEVIFAVPNIDARATAETVALLEGGWGPRIYAIQGDWPSNHALARMRWLRTARPEAFERLAMMTMLSDWVLHRLSGEYCSEPSVASSSGMFDIAAREWSAALAELAGLRADQLPPVYDPGTQIGALSARAAGETGLAAGTPVVIGAADTQSGYVGTNVIAPGDAGLVAGSFWLPAIVADAPLLDPERRVRTNCHAVPGQWIVESCSFYTGLALRWFRDAFCQDEIARARKEGTDPYDLLNRQAERVPPGSHGVQVILSNVANNSHWVHAAPAFLGFDILSPDRHNRVTLYRAMLENAAYQTLGELENIAEVWGSWPGEIALCGGAARSPLWAQIIADTLGIPVRTPAALEASALGTAAYAAVGVGMYQSLSEVCERFVRWGATYQPDGQRHAIYREAYGLWRDIYPHMLSLVEAGLTRPMWRAPGT
jgi:autoinducer 2 (AI-2) kinase